MSLPSPPCPGCPPPSASPTATPSAARSAGPSMSGASRFPTCPACRTLPCCTPRPVSPGSAAAEGPAPAPPRPPPLCPPRRPRRPGERDACGTRGSGSERSTVPALWPTCRPLWPGPCLAPAAGAVAQGSRLRGAGPRPPWWGSGPPREGWRGPPGPARHPAPSVRPCRSGARSRPRSPAGPWASKRRSARPPSRGRRRRVPQRQRGTASLRGGAAWCVPGPCAAPSTQFPQPTGVPPRLLCVPRCG